MKTADEKQKPCNKVHMALSESKYSVVVAGQKNYFRQKTETLSH